METAAGGDGVPVSAAELEQLVGPLVEATRLTLAEMAGAEVALRSAYRAAGACRHDDVSAVLGLPTAAEGLLVLSLPGATAAALARRVLAGVDDGPDEALVRDCVGEVVNVIAGQAKALLAGTPHHFTLSTPTVLFGAAPPLPAGCLVLVFDSDLGELMLRLGRAG